MQEETGRFFPEPPSPFISRSEAHRGRPQERQAEPEAETRSVTASRNTGVVLPGTAFSILGSAQAMLLPAAQATAGLRETYLAQPIPALSGWLGGPALSER